MRGSGFVANIGQIRRGNSNTLYSGSLERWQEQARRDRNIENQRGQQQRTLEGLGAEARRRNSRGDNQEALLGNITGHMQSLEVKIDTNEAQYFVNTDPRIAEWRKRQPATNRRTAQEIGREEVQK